MEADRKDPQAATGQLLAVVGSVLEITQLASNLGFRSPSLTSTEEAMNKSKVCFIIPEGEAKAGGDFPLPPAGWAPMNGPKEAKTIQGPRKFKEPKATTAVRPKQDEGKLREASRAPWAANPDADSSMTGREGRAATKIQSRFRGLQSRRRSAQSIRAGYEAGEMIEAQSSSKKWHQAEIDEVRGRNTYIVSWADGGSRTKEISSSRIRFRGELTTEEDDSPTMSASSSLDSVSSLLHETQAEGAEADIPADGTSANLISRLIGMAVAKGHTQHDATVAIASLFQDADSDGNGVISAEEWSSAFSRIDGNKDGSISRKEWVISQGNSIFLDVVRKQNTATITLDEWRHAYESFGLSRESSLPLDDDLQSLQRCVRSLSSLKLEDLTRRIHEVGYSAGGCLEAGATVGVRVSFKCDSRSGALQRLLSTGERGTVESIDVDGDALIRFSKDPVTYHRISKQNLDKLWITRRLPSQCKQELLAEVRGLLRNLSEATEEAQAAVEALAPAAPPTSIAGYLRRLEELVAPPPEGKDWKQELPAIVKEFFPKAPGKEVQWSEEAYFKDQRGLIAKISKHTGMSTERAGLLSMLTSNVYQKPLARALAQRDPCYAGAMFTLSGLFSHAIRQQGRGSVAPRLYKNLHGAGGLVMSDPAWANLEKPDAAGFKGIVSTGAVTASRHADTIQEKGFCPFIDGRDQLQQGPVVCFESAAPDKHGGLHSALMISNFNGLFPPNTLFRLKEVQSVPFTAEVFNSRKEHSTVSVKQQCLVVTVTFQKPHSLSAESATGSKMTAPVSTLHYGQLDPYCIGVQELIKKPLLTMQEECTRDMEWTDCRNVRHSLRKCWEYVLGPAAKKENCSLGTRDANHDGKNPQNFLAELNKKIRERRKAGQHGDLPEEYSRLTEDEILALRLYSGPAFQPVNGFLRQLGQVQGVYRGAIGSHSGLTFAATVGHLCHAIRKLSAIATPEEAGRTLYRAACGTLPKGFWSGDESEAGLGATDYAFLSASPSKSTPLRYMIKGEAVMWKLQQQCQGGGAFHHGADISDISQFADEREVLFPPWTRLIIGRLKNGEIDKAEEDANEGKLKYTVVRVVPHFV